MNLMVWELINYPKSQQWLDSNTDLKTNFINFLLKCFILSIYVILVLFK
jgi:hypothetical protein